VKAFVIVDIQNDFCPGGALPVKEGNQIIPLINRLQEKFDLVVATQDWHPANHESFAKEHKDKKPGDVIDLHGIEQTLWPVHCVENTEGSEFVKELNRKKVARVFHKGTEQTIDSYSTFFDNGHKKSTGLDVYLNEKGVDEVYLAGLATDYCVKYSALDARDLGLKTHVIIDACRGIDLRRGDVDRAIEEMRQRDIDIIRSEDL